MEKNIFIFDQNKCVGCHACVVACMNENGFQANDRWRNIHNSNNSHYTDLPLFYLSLACNHCDDAPCLKNCPAQAYARDEKTGAIIHHPEKCIGCKYCTWACPYDAPKYNHDKGIIEKCTFCNHRIEEGLKPACANLCPTGALDFSQMEFSKEEAFESSPVPVKVDSSLKIEKLRNKKGPEIDQDLFKNQDRNYIKPIKEDKINARKEWPLVLFTLLCAFAVAIYISGKTETFNLFQKSLFVGMGAIGAILSSLHLGKKFRAWRSISHIKSSWLSREILFYGIFFSLAFLDLFIIHIHYSIISAIGLLLLISIDMLYNLATWNWKLKWHSAQSIFIGLTLAALFLNQQLAFLFLISFRLTLFCYRRFFIYKQYRIVSGVRIIATVASGVMIFYATNPVLSIIFLSIGEIIDRIQFYNELNVSDPQREMYN